MRIVTTNLRMDASYGHMEVNSLQRSGYAAGGSGRAGAESFSLRNAIEGMGVEKHSVSRQQSTMTARSVISNDGALSHICHDEQDILTTAVSEMIGARVRIRDIEPAIGREEAGGLHRLAGGHPRRNIGFANGLQLQMDMANVRYEREMASVHSNGNVRTDDGREISFQLELRLVREDFTYQRRVSRSAAMLLMDPLVLNFTDGAARLGDSRFSFDLDGDGSLENINSLEPGSGYLTLDLDGDGAASNGGELFGPSSGFAFAELRNYDADANNWIDENDPVFDELSIWMGAGGPGQKLVTLREAGVGAISLAGVDTHFNLKDSTGQVVGQVGKSGIFLTEKGEVRSLQEIELRLDAPGMERDVARDRVVATAIDAIALLERMMQIRRSQLHRLAVVHRRLDDEEEKRDWLYRKFWEWQDAG